VVVVKSTLAEPGLQGRQPVVLTVLNVGCDHRTLSFSAVTQIEIREVTKWQSASTSSFCSSQSHGQIAFAASGGVTSK